MNQLSVRQLVPGDVPELQRLEKECYVPQLFEPPETFVNKMTQFPEGCLGAFGDDRMVGYILSIPWPPDGVVPLKSLVEVMPSSIECLYIHDVGVAAAWRHRGVATALVNRVIALGNDRDVNMFSLVAVQGTEPFWKRFGFEAIETFEYVPTVPATRMVKKRRDKSHA